ncbi:MAG TPA: pyridoxal-phosphate dependent enzyme [Actinomycetota bacterium]|nr:pyridoxal-phosphate dependent enzyme [Actinomycetota bacterium]
MTVRTVRQLGDPTLRVAASPIADPRSPTVAALADDLFDTLRATRAATSYGRAIAAPQIGESWRMVVADLGERWTLVNPTITWASDERREWWDACLSFLDTFGRLSRHAAVSVRWQDLDGKTHEERFEDDLAELLQHELDHLDGVLAVDRFLSPRTACTRLEFERRHRRDSPYSVAASGGPDPLRISLASMEIDPVFLHTPQVHSESLSQQLEMTVICKIEAITPIRSFKGRGADWFFRTTNDLSPVVCASAGNFGQGVAYAARSRGISCTVFAAEQANPLKVERMRSFGADVRLGGKDFDSAKEAARQHAADVGGRFVEDGDEPAIAEGAGTIAVELGGFGKLLDAVLVPVGNGALVTGIGAWLKAYAPHTRVVGVCASGAPSMAESWRTGEIRPTPDVNTIADGIAVREPVPRAVEDMRQLVDEVVLVDDADIIEAMRLVHRHLGLVVEPAGVAGLAAAARYRDRFSGQTVGTPLCGGNVTPDQMKEWFPG